MKKKNDELLELEKWVGTTVEEARRELKAEGVDVRAYVKEIRALVQPLTLEVHRPPTSRDLGQEKRDR